MGERLNFVRQIFGVGQVVAVSLGVKTGLGRRIQSLSNRELADLEKVQQHGHIVESMLIDSCEHGGSLRFGYTLHCGSLSRKTLSPLPPKAHNVQGEASELYLGGDWHCYNLGLCGRPIARFSVWSRAFVEPKARKMYLLGEDIQSSVHLLVLIEAVHSYLFGMRLARSIYSQRFSSWLSRSGWFGTFKCPDGIRH